MTVTGQLQATENKFVVLSFNIQVPLTCKGNNLREKKWCIYWYIYFLLMCERAFKSSGSRYNELDVVEIFCKNISKNANLQVSHERFTKDKLCRDLGETKGALFKRQSHIQYSTHISKMETAWIERRHTQTLCRETTQREEEKRTSKGRKGMQVI